MNIFGFNISRNKDSKRNLVPIKESNSVNDMFRQDLASSSIDEFSFPYMDTSNLNDLWNQSGSRKLRYESYDRMGNDTIISSALEMYADDASQYDADNRLMWAESDNEKISKILNRRIKELGLEGKLWSMYYSLSKYGDVYIRQYKYREKTEKVINDKKAIERASYEPFISIVDKPENVFDFSKYGKTVQFAYLNEDDATNTGGYISANHEKRSIELYPSDQFVHIYLDKPDSRARNKQTIYIKNDNDQGNDTQITYDVIEGQSMLDGIYQVQQQIQLLETSIILNRLSKSAITRIVSVEVGDMAPNDVPNVLRRIKSSLENRISLNSKGGMTDYTSSPGGLDNVVVVPTRDGKGAITNSNIGGDVDIKSLADLDYFNNKRFGGLKIPKAFLGYEEALGNNGGGTLTKQDIRYGRTIKRLQTAMVTGITTLMTWYLKSQGFSDDQLTNFIIKVVPPTTADDEERDQQNDAKFKLANNILDMVGDSVDKVDVLKYVFNNIVDEPGLVDVINNSATKEADTSDDSSDTSDDGTDDSADSDDTSNSTSSSSVGDLSPDDIPDKPSAGNELKPSSNTSTSDDTASTSTNDTSTSTEPDESTVTVPSQNSAIK